MIHVPDPKIEEFLKTAYSRKFEIVFYRDAKSFFVVHLKFDDGRYVGHLINRYLDGTYIISLSFSVDPPEPQLK